MKKKFNARREWRLRKIRERVQSRMEKNLSTTIAVFLRIMLDYETIKVVVNDVLWAISTQSDTIRVEMVDDESVGETFARDIYERYAETIGDLVALVLETRDHQAGTFRACVAMYREHTLSGTERPMIEGLDPKVVTVGRARPGDYACRRWICVRHPEQEILNAGDESLFGAALAFRKTLGVHEVEAAVRRAPLWEEDDETITSSTNSRCMLKPAPKLAVPDLMAKLLKASRTARPSPRGAWPYSVRNRTARNKQHAVEVQS